MKKLIYLLVVVMLLSGCASLMKWQKEWEENQGRTDNQFEAYKNKPNLTGLSQNEVFNRFGNPRSTSTSYFGNTKMEYWLYQDIYGIGNSMYITFTDGYVTNVNYH